MVHGALDPVSADTVRVIVYHQCALAATGAALGPRDALSYWWLLAEGLRVVVTGEMPELERMAVRRAIVDELAPAVNDVRRRQDELAEAPDL